MPPGLGTRPDTRDVTALQGACSLVHALFGQGFHSSRRHASQQPVTYSPAGVRLSYMSRLTK